MLNLFKVIALAQYIFKRIEKKYLITKSQYSLLINKITPFTEPDKYGENDICNIYCDTNDFRIIRASIQKPVYKEKLRLRCYGIPDNDTKCFLELKKKFKKVVYKRRIKSEYLNALEYLNFDNDKIQKSQIKEEIEYFRKIFNSPQPKVCIFYKRNAFYDKNDKNVRITFDSNLLFRDYDLDLSYGIYGEKIIDEDLIIMEIKTSGAIPLWLVNILNEEKIYPTSFSKYGTAYMKMLQQNLRSNKYV